MQWLRLYLEKMRGGKRCPARAPWHEIAWSSIGAFLGIFCITLVSRLHNLQLEGSLFLVGSFGASAVLLYGVPTSPYAQPRNLVGGHTVSAIIGVSLYYLLPQQPLLGASLAVALALVAMHLTRTVHPPGGATALIAVIGGDAIHELGYVYVLSPIGLGALVMLSIAVLVNNLSPHRRYPQFWY